MTRKAVRTPVTLGERITLIRAILDCSRPALAAMLKVSRQSVMLWEHDRSVPKDDKLLIMADRSHVSYEWLRWGRGPMPSLPVRHDFPDKTPQVLIREIDATGNPVSNGWAVPLNVATDVLHTRPDQLAVYRVSAAYPPDIKPGDFLFIDRASRAIDPARPSLWLTRLASVGVVVLAAKKDRRGAVVLSSFNNEIVMHAKRSDPHVIGRIIAVVSVV